MLSSPCHDLLLFLNVELAFRKLNVGLGLLSAYVIHPEQNTTYSGEPWEVSRICSCCLALKKKGKFLFVSGAY